MSGLGLTLSPREDYNDVSRSLDLILLTAASSLLLGESGRRVESQRGDVVVCNALRQEQSTVKATLSSYNIIRMPGDGRCLFHAVMFGACRLSGVDLPSMASRCEMADELRQKVAEEFRKRREETEWFLEGPFEEYVSNIQKPHVWGGEPELLMMSHVLKTPISVYISDPRSKGALIAIAEYGQEYMALKNSDKEILPPIRVLYNGYNHYDALEVEEDEAVDEDVLYSRKDF